MSLSRYVEVVAAVAELCWREGRTVGTAVEHAEEELRGIGVRLDRDDLEEYVRSVWYGLAEQN